MAVAKANVMWTGLRAEVSSILHTRVASRDRETPSDFPTSRRRSGSMNNRGDPAVSAEIPGIGGVNVQFALRDSTPSEIPVTATSSAPSYTVARP